MSASAIMSKYRRALRNGTGASFTLEQLREGAGHSPGRVWRMAGRGVALQRWQDYAQRDVDGSRECEG